MKYPKNWNLAPLLKGAGAAYEKIDQVLNRIEREIRDFKIQMPELFGPYQALQEEIHEAGTLILCLTSQDVNDTKATQLEAKHTQIAAAFHSLSLKIEQILVDMPDDVFEKMLQKVKEIEFPVREKRVLAKEKMPLDKELLATDLSISGHSAYTTLYYTFMGMQEFPVDKELLNLSKLENLFSHNDRSMRIKAADSMSCVLGKQKAIFAQILNNIVDYRLHLYKNRGWKNFLHETLHSNRIQETTLNAMWDVVARSKAPLKKYMDHKAKLLGLTKLKWVDTKAHLGNSNETMIPWEKGCDAIINEFHKVSPKMASFARHALEKGWVDAAPSSTKRAGGYCAGVPLLKESRILMTYMDNFGSKSTLAHELGHAYHNHVLFDKPPLLQNFPINIAEAASTMCEMIVGDSAIKGARSEREKMILLDDKINRYLAFNMDLHSRFLFEKAFHEERAKGFIPPERIDELMVEAQKIGYANHLENYLPCFWSYKMHFYFTDATFYNWTYTFGYLFSLGLYAHLLKTGGFESAYIALLQDTGGMSIEALAQKHLDVDLTKSSFWQGAIDLANRDIDEFIKCTDTSL